MSTCILSFNPGHDGAVAILQDRFLKLCIESEKDSGYRHQPANAATIVNALRHCDCIPDVIATSGWEMGSFRTTLGTSYTGITENLVRRSTMTIAGTQVELFESTHERSHLFCSYGLSPYEQGEPCYVLIWEGVTGTFYEVDRNLQILEYPPVMLYPGYKYAFLYDLADPQQRFGTWNSVAPGKLMALASYSRRGEANPEEAWVIDEILNNVVPPQTDKRRFRSSSFLNCGVTLPAFMELAGKFSDAMFEKFYKYAKDNLKTRSYPLLIAGGCGLNCEWNSKWRDCSLFRGIFIPPVTNDSGSAIGTAIEAQYFSNHHAKVTWNVYSGPDFVFDSEIVGEKQFVNYDGLALLILGGEIVAWVNGRCEIGPRALGHRSLLAAPFSAETRDHLNRIKQRENYRPIAPVCLEEDAHDLFGVDGPSPYMLEIHSVRAAELKAITHVDGSARVQTVSQSSNSELHALLQAFKRLTGFGVLCNTSLNFPGRGFINRSSDLVRYASRARIRNIVVNGDHYKLTRWPRGI
jgi:hydroxymethyl cephem carbamoyltransferase